MERISLKAAVAAAAVTLGMAGAANATIITQFEGIAAGKMNFNSTVTGAGGTVNVDTWTSFGSGSSEDRGDYTVTNTDGGFLSTSTQPGMSGRSISIGPSGGTSNPRSNPLDYRNSGITFTFDDPVNSIGFEVGDWATCCFDPVTELFIQFDGGTPIKVASATQTSDGEFPNQFNPSRNVDAIWVAAFDDTDDFSTVSFWGNGIGEALYAGGEVRYALVDQGSLPPTGQVPLPAAAWMLLAGLGGLGVMRKRQKS